MYWEKKRKIAFLAVVVIALILFGLILFLNSGDQFSIETERMHSTSSLNKGWITTNTNLSTAFIIPKSWSNKPLLLEIYAKGIEARQSRKDINYSYFLLDSSIAEVLNSDDSENQNKIMVERKKQTPDSKEIEQVMVSFGEIKRIHDLSQREYLLTTYSSGDITLESAIILSDLELSYQYSYIPGPQSFPSINVYINGEKKGSVLLDSEEISKYTFRFNYDSGKLDLMLEFDNWQEGRNLFIENITITK